MYISRNAISTVGIIDYGMGNIHSVYKAIERVSPESRIKVSADPAVLKKMDRLLLPGVGSIQPCMDALEHGELIDTITRFVELRPLMGLCLGIAALGLHSEENGGVACLGLYAGTSRKLEEAVSTRQERLKVPHMGWNTVRQSRSHYLWSNIPDESWFYFVHSYYVDLHDQSFAVGTSRIFLVYESVI